MGVRLERRSHTAHRLRRCRSNVVVKIEETLDKSMIIIMVTHFETHSIVLCSAWPIPRGPQSHLHRAPWVSRPQLPNLDDGMRTLANRVRRRHWMRFIRRCTHTADGHLLVQDVLAYPTATNFFFSLPVCQSRGGIFNQGSSCGSRSGPGDRSNSPRCDPIDNVQT